ncbi:protein takeout [Toxorhynchites rutilus septentrionalis]|uniref:protein takeout n=1 Tax=Toxorhynchites rutilus septentrionalis TaxID=329112 RepID=UPI002478A464|nr:protein takeout [Toxorhynchites rutilus septentrionalis]
MKSTTCFLLLSCVSTMLTRELPTTFQRCKQKDPNFEGCIVNAINGALRLMKNGLPEFGILPLDPLLVNSLSIEQGSSSPINLKQEFQNVKLNNLVNSTVTKFVVDLERFVIRAEAITPHMEFVGDYTMDGRVLLLPVTGRGFSNVTLRELGTTHELIGEPVKKKGETYMRINKYNVKFDNPKLMTVLFTNLFNGDKALGDAMNKVLNDNWQLMFNELQGAYEDTFGYIFRDITNKLFLKVPLNKIFLEE